MPTASTTSSATSGASTASTGRRLDVGGRARALAAIVTPLGWTLGVLGAVTFVVGRRYGWDELVVIAGVFAVCLLVAIGFTFGRLVLAVDLEVVPQRVAAGRRSAAQVLVTNTAARRSSPFRMELGVGVGQAEFQVPALAPGADHEEVFVLPTIRRAVIPVGPATSVRSDPLGLLRRALVWTDAVDLYVHPRTVPLDDRGNGLLRDLEGITTQDLSAADVAFHTLREYQTGDDRRFVHWLSTAKAGKLMVRQFVDTRRVHLMVTVDGLRESYADDGELDLAVEIAASLGLRTLLDDQELTMAAAGRRVPTTSSSGMLDALAAVDYGGAGAGLAPQADQLVRRASGVSLAALVTGSRPRVADVRVAATHVPADVRTLVLRAAPGERSEFRPIGSLLVLTVAALDDLPRLLWRAARG